MRADGAGSRQERLREMVRQREYGAMADADPPPPADLAWGDSESAEPVRPIRLGRFTMLLTPRGLVGIRLDGHPVIDRIFYSVRGVDWSTERAVLVYGAGDAPVPFTAGYPKHRLELSGGLRAVGDGFEVTFTGRSIEPDRPPVPVNRVGPCVLHPGAQAGRAVRVTGPGGEESVTVLPVRVSANPVLGPARRLAVDLAPTGIAVELDGGDWETEDQRNWSDEGFKSYTPPLAQPRPLVVPPGGIRIHRVRITPLGPPRDAGRSDRSLTVAWPRPSREPDPRGVGVPDTAIEGAMPAVGLPHSGGALPGPALDAIRDLRPSFLHLVADLSVEDWRERLVADASAAGALDVAVTLTAVCGTDRAPLADLPRLTAGRLTTLLVFDQGRAGTSSDLARAARRAVGASVTVGGGSRAHLANLLVPHAEPVDELDVLAVPVSACAHDVDRAAVRSSLGSHPALLAAAASIAAGRPLMVGPVGYLPSWNSWAPGDAVRPGWGPGTVRQRSVFTAAWAVAALAGFARAAVASVSLFHTLGTGGIGTVNGATFQPFPVWYALREFAGTAGMPQRRWATPPGTAGLSLAGGPDLLACLADEPVSAQGIAPTARVIHAAAQRIVVGPVDGPTLPAPCVVVRGSANASRTETA